MDSQKAQNLVNVKNSSIYKEIFHILKAIFNLTKKQTQVFLQLRLKVKQETCILNLVHQLDSERSIIQKYLRTLMKKNLVVRRSVTLSEFQERCRENNRQDIIPSTTKGYLYLYAPIPDEELLQKAQKITSNWNKKLDQFFS